MEQRHLQFVQIHNDVSLERLLERLIGSGPEPAAGFAILPRKGDGEIAEVLEVGDVDLGLADGDFVIVGEFATVALISVTVGKSSDSNKLRNGPMGESLTGLSTEVSVALTLGTTSPNTPTPTSTFKAESIPASTPELALALVSMVFFLLAAERREADALRTVDMLKCTNETTFEGARKSMDRSDQFLNINILSHARSTRMRGEALQWRPREMENHDCTKAKQIEANHDFENRKFKIALSTAEPRTQRFCKRNEKHVSAPRGILDLTPAYERN